LENLKYIDFFIFVIDDLIHIKYVDDMCNQCANQGILMEYILIFNNKNNKVIEKNTAIINEYHNIIEINLNKGMVHDRLINDINHLKK